MKKTILTLASAYLFLLFASGCLSDSLKDLDGIVAEPELAIPIGKVSFEMKDFIEDDSTFTVSSDGLAQIILREENIASLSTEELLEDFSNFWTFEFAQEKQIGIINVNDISNTGFYSLKAVVDEMDDPFIQQAFRMNDGGSAPIPAFDEPVNFDIGMPPFANFRNIEIDSGTLTMTVENGFSFGLEDVIFEIYDNVTATFIHKFNKGTIAPGEKFDLVLDLKDKVINNEIFIKMPRFKSPGSATPVPIDLQQRMVVSVAITGLKIRKGEVEVPPTSLPLYNEIIDLKIDNDVKLSEANIKTANLNYSFLSEVKVPIEITVNLPTVTKNGMSFSEKITVSDGSETGTFDLSEYKIDFGTDATQNYNRLPVELTVFTAGSGTDLVQFDQAAKISADFELKDLEMENFTGNAGSYVEKMEKTEFDFDVDFSFLDPETKRIFLENPKIEVFYENSFGLPLEAEINATATGHFGAVENLNPPKFIMDYPTLAQAGTTVSGIYEINANNSNISNLLAVFPEKISYEGEVKVNPSGINDLTNYVSIDSRVTVGVDLELPLVFRTENLVFKDTISNEPISEENPDEIQSIFLMLDYKNDLPFTTTIDLNGIDAAGNESSVLEAITIESAETDGNGKSIATKEGRVEIELSRAEIDALLAKEKLVMTVRLKTGSDGQMPGGIYTTDGIEVGLAARIQLKIEE